MNSDQLAGKWQQMKGEAKVQWGKLTDDDLMTIGGQKDELIGKVQERYGYAKEEAQRRVDEWLAAGSSMGSPKGDHQMRDPQNKQGNQPPAGKPIAQNNKQPNQQTAKNAPQEELAHKH